MPAVDHEAVEPVLIVLRVLAVEEKPDHHPTVVDRQWPGPRVELRLCDRPDVGRDEIALVLPQLQPGGRLPVVLRDWPEHDSHELLAASNQAMWAVREPPTPSPDSAQNSKCSLVTRADLHSGKGGSRTAPTLAHCSFLPLQHPAVPGGPCRFNLGAGGGKKITRHGVLERARGEPELHGERQIARSLQVAGDEATGEGIAAAEAVDYLDRCPIRLHQLARLP